MDKALVINLFAGPGAGKTTMATGIFYELKSQGINCELATEFAKEIVWEESFKIFQDQLYILGKQHHRIQRVSDKVEVIVTDCPLMLSIIYNNVYSEIYNKLVYEIFNRYNNINYFVERKKAYLEAGRYQGEEEAKSLDVKIKEMLSANNVTYQTVEGTKSGVNSIVENIVKKFNRDFYDGKRPLEII